MRHQNQNKMLCFAINVNLLLYRQFTLKLTLLKKKKRKEEEYAINETNKLLKLSHVYTL